MGEQPKLSLKDLHPVLRMTFECGCEVEHALASSIRKTGETKTALNLTDAIEENWGKIVGYKEIRDFSGKVIGKKEIYAREHRWRVNFDTETNGTHSRGGLSVVLDGVSSVPDGVRNLKRIALELQKVYDLPYTPRIYRNGEPLENPAQTSSRQ